MENSVSWSASEWPAKLTHIPPELVCVEDYERLAAQFVPESVLAYFSGGSADEHGLVRNRQRFTARQLYSRVLADVSQGNTRCRLLGQELEHPLVLAPLAYQGLVHPQGELDTARGAEAVDACMAVSTLSSYRLEDIAAHSSAPQWFQLYWQERRADTLSLLRRAERAGYSALLLTVDVPVQALRNRQQRSGFQLPAQAAANLSEFASPATVELAPGASRVFQGIMAQAPSWQDIAWLRQQTDLPLLLKGVTHPDDAVRARELGCAGVVVSNHGGRALDSLPASIDVLAAVRMAVGAEFPLLLDGGVRSGEDVFKALALGADAVMVGRPQVFALAVAGALGVAHMLRSLREELEVTMSLCGCANLAAIGPQSLVNPAGELPCCV
ncbi:MAG: alpha-hydroxy-acid oxidizing protein [Gammaproteobacteria bacterium]|nr:alpha-hydroxy-acid oxidizing protein [Gammaproteobacteria bacterium]